MFHSFVDLQFLFTIPINNQLSILFLIDDSQHTLSRFSKSGKHVLRGNFTVDIFAGLLMEPFVMATHKKAGVRKWNHAENARFFVLFFPLCTMWRKINFFLSSLFLAFLPCHLSLPREIWPCNSEAYFTGELSAKNYTLTSASLVLSIHIFFKKLKNTFPLLKSN